MGARFQDRDPTSVLGLLVQALLVGGVMLVVQLLVDGGTPADWSFAGVFAASWFLLGLYRVRRRATAR